MARRSPERSRSSARRAGPSQRQLRVGESLRHELADLLLRDGLRDPALTGAQVTVTEVRVSPDLRQARVFVTELGGGLRPELAAALSQAAPLWRGELARRLRLRIAPELTFQADRSFDEADRIERLLATERAALVDLAPESAPDESAPAEPVGAEPVGAEHGQAEPFRAEPATVDQVGKPDGEG